MHARLPDTDVVGESEDVGDGGRSVAVKSKSRRALTERSNQIKTSVGRQWPKRSDKAPPITIFARLEMFEDWMPQSNQDSPLDQSTSVNKISQPNAHQARSSLLDTTSDTPPIRRHRCLLCSSVHSLQTFPPRPCVPYLPYLRYLGKLTGRLFSLHRPLYSETTAGSQSHSPLPPRDPHLSRWWRWWCHRPGDLPTWVPYKRPMQGTDRVSLALRHAGPLHSERRVTPIGNF